MIFIAKYLVFLFLGAMMAIENYDLYSWKPWVFILVLGLAIKARDWSILQENNKD